eukprot:jgi/Chlat1/5908/Chrsp4S06405
MALRALPASLAGALRPALAARRFATNAAAQAKAEGGVALVQGASRGIGLEFVSTSLASDLLMDYNLLSRDSSTTVIASCRSPSSSDALSSLLNQYAGRLHVVQVDVTDEGSVAAAAAEVGREHPGGLDCVVNTVGVLSGGGMEPETSLSKVTVENLLRCYAVNAVGHVIVAKHFLPLLYKGEGRASGRETAVLASLSARVGSIGDNKLGGWHSYRASKTALNQLNRNIAIEVARRKKKVACIVLHPGTVDTDLSKPFQRNVPEGKLFTPEHSVKQARDISLLKVIDGATMESNGRFFAYDGSEIPW